MGTIWVALKDGGASVAGTVTVQALPLPGAPTPAVTGADVLVTRPVTTPVGRDGAQVPAEPSPEGWYQRITARTDTGKSETVCVVMPDDGDHDLGDLETVDPARYWVQATGD